MKKFAFLGLLCASNMLAADPYPLDPLSYDEQVLAVGAVNGVLGSFDPDHDIFDQIVLLEPKKADVLAFNNGGPLPARHATVTLWKGEPDDYLKFTVKLDYVNDELANADVVSIKKLNRSRPSWTCTDNAIASQLVMANPEFRAGLIARGVKEEEIDTHIYLDTFVDGRLNEVPGDSSESCSQCDCQGPLAILKECPRPHSFIVTAYWNDGDPSTTAAYIQPIEGLTAIVDRRSNEVIEVVDTGVITPIVKGTLNWDRGSRDTLKPLAVGMPEGASYRITGNLLEWENWSMRFSFHPVTNLMLYQIKYKDRSQEEPMSILYRANLSELITTYGTPDFPSNARSFLDFHEYPAREFAPPLIKGLDVPPYADLLDAPVTFADGSTDYLPAVLGIYEQDAGVLWRHTNYPCACDVCETSTLGRRARQLVLTSLVVIGNYDYSVFWIFNQDGRIDVEVKASGVVECEGTNFVRTNPNIKYGNLIYPNVIGTNHLHELSARLDFDLDGVSNRVHEMSYELSPVSEENPCGNGFDEVETLLTTEKKAVRDHDFRTLRSWVVENDHSHTLTGHHRGYEIVPSPMAENLLNHRSRLANRATYLKHNLFVTRYNDDELDVMGQFPVERGCDLGLAKYIENDQDIVDKDIVVWYNTGFGHKPRVEDYPVMPTETVRFSLVPHNCFNENPGLDVDKYKLVACAGCEAENCQEEQSYN
jgi:primary-amine oxidase